MKPPPAWKSLGRAAWLHRISGLLLAAFLPAHFLLLGLALERSEAFDKALALTEFPLVKLAEIGLVFLLAVHLVGGVRLLIVEFLPWHDWQKPAAVIAVLAALVAGAAFGVRAVL